MHGEVLKFEQFEIVFWKVWIYYCNAGVVFSFSPCANVPLTAKCHQPQRPINCQIPLPNFGGMSPTAFKSRPSFINHTCSSHLESTNAVIILAPHAALHQWGTRTRNYWLKSELHMSTQSDRHLISEHMVAGSGSANHVEHQRSCVDKSDWWRQEDSCLEGRSVFPAPFVAWFSNKV